MKSLFKVALIPVLLSIVFLFYTGNLLSDPDIPGIPLERDPVDVAINPLTNKAIAVNEKSDSVSVVDLDIQEVTATISVGKKPEGIAIDNTMNIAVVANSKDDEVTIIDLNSDETVAVIPVGKDPVKVAVNQNTHTALIVNHKDDSVSVIDLMTYGIIDTIPVGREPIDIAIDPELNLALVVNEKDWNISVIDLTTYQVTGTVTVGKKPQAIDINPETHIAIVANKKDNTVSIINLLTWNSYTIPIEKHPVDVTINPLDNRALVICEKDRMLLLIDLDAGTIVHEYLINKKSEAVAVNPYTNIAGVVDSKTDSLTLIQLPNPIPQINSIDPDTILRGSSDTLINIQGSKFIMSSSVVLTSDLSLLTSFIDNHNIQAVIPEEKLSSTGSFPVTVLNPAPEGGTSNSINLQINNPIPFISMLDPAETMAGTTSLTVNVHGTGFFDDTTVYINGISRTFTLISQTSLQLGLTASDLETGAYLEITASNPPPGGGLSAPAVFTVFNPVPTLLSINPISIIAGSPEFTLTLTGNNFVKTSVVSFNVQQFSTTYISKTQIEAAIPSNAIETAGDYPVTVINPAPGGGEIGAVIFTVTPATQVEPLPEGSFGKEYESLIPTDATIGAYDPNRFSIITGMVKDRTDNPLSGVRVSIHNHPEYGSAQTDNEGRFSIPVDGGGTITIAYEKTGFITAHRKVYVPWNDVAIAEIIVMIPEDTIATTVTFDGNPSTIITHKSSTVTDERGSRSMTIVFTGDNRAFTTDENGVEVELTSITTRATEFDTPESMPAKLPPNSAYTYAAELSADGAKNVRFEKPVVTYVDNFLGFDVGEIVPVGYYDRDRAVWVPSDNGVVVKLLDTDTDGVVDALDSTGDGQPNDLNNNGSFSDEVTGLDNPSQYQPDSTYWRTEITHFTPWDCNWPYGPPPDATEPDPDGEPDSDDQEDDDDEDCPSSSVERRSRIFHEDITIPGTDMTLHYASNRVKGYKSVITIPASGQTVPTSLKSIIVKMEVAGRLFETTLAPLPNQKAEFIWDGLDYLGQPVTGSRTAKVSIGFVYNAVYYSAGDFTRAFAQAGMNITGIRARQEVISWKRSDMVIHRGSGTLANGWTLSAHHYMSPSDPFTLYKGDGTIIRNVTLTIDTIAGNGQQGYNGDGGPATQASLYNPQGVTVDGEGNIYIADTYNHRIRKIDKQGIISTIAGTGECSTYIVHGPARWAKLCNPTGVAINRTGNIYIAEEMNNVIRMIDTNGTITRIAGTGQAGYSGDGGPATEAMLCNPKSLALDNSGNIYIADTCNKRIRKVDPGGIITTIAGNGQQGYSGDGGPATEASLSGQWPFGVAGVAVDKSGNIYIADLGTRAGRITVS